MMHRLLFILSLAATAHAQQTFQVATIKPSPPDAPRATQIRGNRFFTTGTSLQDLLVYAYNVHPSQIVNGPAWLATTKFDVLADPETEKRPTSDEMKAMVARLLTDRFHLVIRHEKRDLPIYAIVRTSKPLLFHETEGDTKSFPTATGGFVPPGTLAVRNGTLANLAAFIQRFATADITRPVVDQTNIPGHFDFDLHYTPANASTQPADGQQDNPPPNIFTAIQEQLGLKLEPTKASVEVMFIASVSQPTSN
jgi:uncharacterized protein (TIGR03435 family)